MVLGYTLQKKKVFINKNYFFLDPNKLHMA